MTHGARAFITITIVTLGSAYKTPREASLQRGRELVSHSVIAQIYTRSSKLPYEQTPAPEGQNGGLAPSPSSAPTAPGATL